MPLANVDPAAYEQLLEQKAMAVSELFRPWGAPTPRVFASRPTGYRMRAEFRIWHTGEQLDYVMFRRSEPDTPVPIAEFPVACEQIQALMPVLLAELRPDQVLRRKLFQVEFLSTLAGDTLVSLIYHRRLDDDWLQAAEHLADSLGISIVGRSRRQKVVVGRDYVEERLPVGGEQYSYRQYEQAFTQPNGELNTRMIEWACEQARSLEGDLLELYCGNGNFTLPLSRHFGQVIATELSKTSIRAARENIAANGIDNVHMIRLSAQEVTQAMNREREFRRLAILDRPLHQFDLRTLFVDPPRAGMDEHTAAMATRFDSIIYISCNPLTLSRDLACLYPTHQIEQFAMFDQFPYTEHMECGMLLRRRDVPAAQRADGSHDYRSKP